MTKIMLSQEYISESLSYNQETGSFFWKCRPLSHFNNQRICNCWNSRFSNMPAGSIDYQKYLRINIGGKQHFAHRLAFFLMMGRWPEFLIDHINHNRSDNRWDNLRETTNKGNCQNRKLPTKNKSGLFGVQLVGKSDWNAYIYLHGKNIPLGRFKTKKEAIEARKSAEPLYGFHPNHGKQITGICHEVKS